MRHLFVTLLFLTLALGAFSQRTDIIKLHTFEIVRGTITETIPDVSVSILSLPDSVLRVILFSDIEKVIYKEGTPSFEKSKAVRQSPRGKSSSGSTSFKGYVRAGYGGQLQEDEGFVSNTFLKVDLILGATFSDKFSLGLGAGVRKGNNDITMVPFFLDLRLSPGEEIVSPMLALSVGASFQLWKDYGPTKFINPEVGIRIGKPNRTNAILAVGVEFIDFVADRKESAFGLARIENTGTKQYNGYSISLLIGF